MSAHPDLDPLRIRCEGSGTPTAFFQTGATICRMCGHTVPAYGSKAIASEHERTDLLAMIARGDFDG